MHRRHHAQRQHIIHSLDTTLYQLHTLSFFLSPSLWGYLCRIFAQFQCSKPRDLDATRSLRFFFVIVFTLNLPSLWLHAFHRAGEGRSIILDFIGMSYTPSKLSLFSLDALIIFLQWVLVTIAYEASVSQHITEAEQDMLLPFPASPLPSALPSPITSTPSSPIAGRLPDHTKTIYPPKTPPDVIDLRLHVIVARLRNPVPPPARASDSHAVLPLPNTTPWPLPAGMRLLMRAGRNFQREAAAGSRTVPTRQPEVSTGNRGGTTMPGAMDS